MRLFLNTVRLIIHCLEFCQRNSTGRIWRRKRPSRDGRGRSSELKRGLILDAARKVFEVEGLDGASLRAIAAEAGYTPAALYFHFDSKEAIYAEVLQASLASLSDAVGRAVERSKEPAERLRAAAMAFFQFYAENPRDLDLGFYLFRGGMKPKGLGHERDDALNAGARGCACGRSPRRPWRSMRREGRPIC